jgi:hypothetical protein
MSRMRSRGRLVKVGRYSVSAGVDGILMTVVDVFLSRGSFRREGGFVEKEGLSRIA